VRRKQWARSGRRAALLAPLALVLSGCSTAQWERNLRFGWPTGVTKQAKEARVLWTWTGVTALALGVVVWALIFWCCIRYRKKSDDQIPRQTKYNFLVEMVCFAFPFVIIAGLFYRTVIVEDDENHLSKNPDVAIQVNAFKWGWQFEYHTYSGAGTGSPTNPTVEAYSNPTTGAALTNPADASLPAAQRRPYYIKTTGSQYEIPVLVIPIGQTVQFDEHSEDVLHSFWVPEFLFKRDVIPYGTTATNRDNKFEITATHTGSFVGRCAELCGVYHSQMNFEVRVVAQSTFVKYMAALKKLGPNDASNQAQALKMAMPNQSPYATTTHPFLTDRTARKASPKTGS
jgi:cytochrome c oxidase subunit 2